MSSLVLEESVDEFTEPAPVSRRLLAMDLRFELDNDAGSVAPLVEHLLEQIAAMQLFAKDDGVRIRVALTESLLNAIHHGNLELDSDLRQDDESIYHDLAETRRVQWPYCDRRVQVLASFSRDRLKVVIRDEGPGFNHRRIRNPTLDRVGGRGLLLIRSFMDEVTFNDRGNQVTLIKYTSRAQALLAGMERSTGGSPVAEITAAEITGEPPVRRDYFAPSSIAAQSIS